MDFLFAHLYEVGVFIGGLITGGVAGSFITYRVTTTNHAANGSSQVIQRGARAGGDIVGGNKTTRP